MHLLFEIPVVEDHAHGDDVSLGEGIFEEVSAGGLDTVCKAGDGDVALGDWGDRWEVEADAVEGWVLLCGFD